MKGDTDLWKKLKSINFYNNDSEIIKLLIPVSAQFLKLEFEPDPQLFVGHGYFFFFFFFYKINNENIITLKKKKISMFINYYLTQFEIFMFLYFLINYLSRNNMI